MSKKWTAADIPDQSGRVAVVTGGNSGLGLETARELARHGARVVLTARDPSKGAAAVADITASVPGAEVSVGELDLASLDSVRAFANGLGEERLDLLINNAGIMMTPPQKTADGFEMQFGTNHLGHFALTGLLLDRLTRAEAARVVTLSSIAHKRGRLDFDDLQREQNYGPQTAYEQSKLANAVFGVELDRRLRAAGSPIVSALAHPGYSATNLQSTGPTGVMKSIMSVTNHVLAQSADRGALPTLYAATAPGVDGGAFVGPDGFFEARGHPTYVDVVSKGRNPEAGLRLWKVSEELTGVRYEIPTAAAS